MPQIKVGAVTFEHTEDFTGEVRLIKAGVELTVSVAALRAFVAESVRQELRNQLERMKPEQLLRKLA